VSAGTPPAPLGEYAQDFDGTQPLCQGDVLEFLSAEPLSPGRHRLGVVVTANCDLAFGKHRGVVTYVPLVSVDAYVGIFVIPRLLEQECNSAEKKVHEICVRPGAARRAIEMAKLGYSPEIGAEVVDDPAAKARLVEALIDVTRYSEALSSVQNAEDGDSAIDILKASLSSSEGGRTPKKAGKSLRGKIKSHLNRLPGDALFLSAVGPNHEEGYIATLRLIRQVSEDRVALKAIDEMRSPDYYDARRASRLDVLYCHRLVQQMAGVFTDIGLPESYEEARDSHLALYIDRLTGV
jgi:hypothetical protein